VGCEKFEGSTIGYGQPRYLDGDSSNCIRFLMGGRVFNRHSKVQWLEQDEQDKS
jgi:hypothetical protein